MIFSESLIIGIVFGSILSGWFFMLICLRMMGILQQEGYSSRALVKWGFHKGNLEERRLVLLAISLGLLFQRSFCDNKLLLWTLCDNYRIRSNNLLYWTQLH